MGRGEQNNNNCEKAFEAKQETIDPHEEEPISKYDICNVLDLTPYLAIGNIIRSKQGLEPRYY